MLNCDLDRQNRLIRRVLFVVALVMSVAVPKSGYGQDAAETDDSKRATSVPEGADNGAVVKQPDAKQELEAPEQKPRVLSRAEKRRIAARRRISQRISAELLAASRSAFVRGLLPVEDYAERLNGARELALAAIDADDRTARVAVMQKHAVMWEEAVERLRRFQQPASQGWDADLAYAQMMQATSQLNIAKATGNDAQGRAAIARRADFAQRQFEQRLADLDIGRATLAQLAESFSQFRQTAGDAATKELTVPDDARLDERLERAGGEVQTRVANLREQPAGVSRRDALQRIQYELSLTAADESVRHENEREVTSRTTDAYQAAARMSSTQQRVYPEGTATLADLTRSWRLRRDANERLRPDDDQSRATAFDAEMKAELARLVSLAGTIADRRGRNEADVVFVRSLNVLTEWQAEEAVAVKPSLADRVKH